MPMSAPGAASMACRMCVSSWPGIVNPLTSSPKKAAPIRAPRKAPTIPPQKRSGRKMAKCQRARPIITHANMALSAGPPVPLVARPLGLVALVVLEHEVLGPGVGRQVLLRLGLHRLLGLLGLLALARLLRLALARLGRHAARRRGLVRDVLHHLLEL